LAFFIGVKLVTKKDIDSQGMQHLFFLY